MITPTNSSIPINTTASPFNDHPTPTATTPPLRQRRKFVVIELCQGIMLETIEMANLEYFSSNPRMFSIYGDGYNAHFSPDEWHFFGNFTAANVRKAQVLT